MPGNFAENPITNLCSEVPKSVYGREEIKETMENEKRKLTIDVIIPVYKPGEKFRKLLVMLQKQTYPVNQIIVLNTEEKYWNGVWEKKLQNLVLRHIKKEEFDHGKTRQQGVEMSKADVFLCMTDDAVPADTHLIGRIMEGFSLRGPLGEVPVVVYARQLPDKTSGPIERYTRHFSYPNKALVKTAADLPRLGIKTYMASNVCCAYRREIYDRQGGFVYPAIFNEDMVFAGRAVQAGYAVVYQAGARVIHAHNYSGRQQFHRNFDLGVSQADYPDVFSGVPSEGEGIRLVKQTARYLVRSKKPWLLFDLVIKSSCKYAGYLLGKHYRSLPGWIIRCCTMNPIYWENIGGFAVQKHGSEKHGWKKDERKSLSKESREIR